MYIDARKARIVSLSEVERQISNAPLPPPENTPLNLSGYPHRYMNHEGLFGPEAKLYEYPIKVDGIDFEYHQIATDSTGDNPPGIYRCVTDASMRIQGLMYHDKKRDNHFVLMELS